MANLNFFKGFKGFAILEKKFSRVPKNFKDFTGFQGFFQGCIKIQGCFKGFKGLWPLWIFRIDQNQETEILTLHIFIVNSLV